MRKFLNPWNEKGKELLTTYFICFMIIFGGISIIIWVYNFLKV